MLWLGERTRQVAGAHVDYLRGIDNPVGVKLGSTADGDDALRMLDLLDPDNTSGRIVLICRMGAGKVEGCLPPLIRAVQRAERTVVWCCDPMHGNTVTASNGLKTRDFENILHEVREFFQVHADEGSYAGGVHFEMTGQDVTECRGGAQALRSGGVVNAAADVFSVRVTNVKESEPNRGRRFSTVKKPNWSPT